MRCGKYPRLKAGRAEGGKYSIFVICRCGSRSGGYLVSEVAPAKVWRAAEYNARKERNGQEAKG